MLMSNQRGRGQEPVTVQGRILSAVIVNMGVDNPGMGFVQGQGRSRYQHLNRNPFHRFQKDYDLDYDWSANLVVITPTHR